MFEQNLSVIRRRFPALVADLEALAEEGVRRVTGEADAGSLSFEISGERVDLGVGGPARVAEWIGGLEWNRIRHGILTCVGMADAAHLLALVPYLDPALDLFIVEPHSTLCAGLLHRFDLRLLLERENTQLLLDGTPIELAQQYAEHVFWPKLLRLSTAMLVHPAVERYAPGFAPAFSNQLTGLANTVSINRNTNTVKARNVVPNTCANLTAWLDSPGVVVLHGSCAGLPAAVVSPGPSLEDDLGVLHAERHKMVLIAVDTALAPLLRRGIVPDLVVSIDMSEGNARNYRAVEIPPDCRLIFEPMVHPSIPSRFDGARFVGLSWQPVGAEQPSGALSRWIASLTTDYGRLVGLGSTSITAFGLAQTLGCNPIVLVGQDLAYPDRKTYAAGVAHAGDKGEPPGELEAMDVHGNPVPTSAAFVLFRRHLEQLIRTGSQTVFNSSQRGAFISGAGVLPLADALAGRKAIDPPPSMRLARAAADWTPPDPSALRDALRQVLEVLAAHEAIDAAAPHLPALLRPIVLTVQGAWQIPLDDAMLEARTAAALGQRDREQAALRQARAIKTQATRQGRDLLLGSFRTALAQLGG